jgi:hypothetical protein
MEALDARRHALDVRYRAICNQELDIMRAQLSSADAKTTEPASDPRIPVLQAERERLIGVLAALEERVDAYERRPMRARIRRHCEVRPRR